MSESTDISDLDDFERDLEATVGRGNLHTAAELRIEVADREATIAALRRQLVDRDATTSRPRQRIVSESSTHGQLW